MWGHGSLAQVMLGGFLLHLVMGLVYTWGSLTMYVTSYLRQYDDSITYDDTIIIYALIVLGQALVMTIGGMIEQRTGPRVAAALGSLFLVGPTLLASRLTSLWGMALGFGLCFGFGGGLTYTVPLVCGYRWDSSKKGWISGVVLSGFGASALVFNQVQAAIVNPHNLKPEVEFKNKRYFAPGPVTDAVPGMFVKLAGIFAALAVVGVLLLRDPAYKKIDDVRSGGGAGVGLLQGSRAAAGAGASPLRRRLYDDDHDHDDHDDDGQGDGADGYHAAEEGTPKGSYDGQPVVVAAAAATAGAAAGAGKDGKDEAEDLAPLQLLRTPQAWHVTVTFLMGSLSGLVTLSTYKSYGIVNFVDDRFMSFYVGSIASACNASGRILWGFLSDRIGAYRTLRAASLLQALALLTWGLTIDPLDSKWAYAVWVGLVCLCHGGGFAVYPALTADLWGKSHASSNFGCIFLGYGSMSLIGLAVLPRLSTALSPLNYFLGAIALGAAANITCLDRCYPPHHLHNGGGGCGRKSNNNSSSNGFALLASGNGGSAASLN